MNNVKSIFQSLHETIKTRKSQVLKDESRRTSSIIQAAQHKEMGNQCLQAGFIDEAIMHYTKSIVSSRILYQEYPSLAALTLDLL